MQIQEFGQTPKQLFTVPHPSRNAATSAPITTIDYNATMAGSGDGDNKSAVSEETVFSPASRLSRKPSILSTTSTTTTATVVGNSSSNGRGSSADSMNAQLQLEQLMQSSERLLHEKNHPTSTTSTNSPNSSNVNNEDVPDISIVHLDESFKLEVDALEAESAQQAAINNNNTSGNNANRPVSSINGRGSPYPGPPSSQGGSPGHSTTGNLVVFLLFFLCLFCFICL